MHEDCTSRGRQRGRGTWTTRHRTNFTALDRLLGEARALLYERMVGADAAGRAQCTGVRHACDCPAVIANRGRSVRRGRREEPADNATDLLLREARADDLDRLVQLESEGFKTDRLSRRSYQKLLQRRSAQILVAHRGTVIVGAVVLLFKRTSSIARLYSLAVARTSRGRGVGRALLRAAEHAALERDCAVLRLEVRVDNNAARGLYESEGFTVIANVSGYYADGSDAVRLERSLWDESSARPAAPYYAQTLDFTCGSAALMMAMASIDSSVKLDRRLEIRLWREATTVFMTSGHGGCGPYGLALAARARGFDVTIYAPLRGPMFVSGVRDPEKKTVIALVEDDFLDELAETDVTIRRGSFNAQTLIGHLRRGDAPIVLISLFRLHGERGPHWVTVVGYDSHVFRVLDPMSPPAGGRPPELSITQREFERMSRYGREREAAAVVLSPKPDTVI